MVFQLLKMTGKFEKNIHWCSQYLFQILILCILKIGRRLDWSLLTDPIFALTIITTIAFETFFRKKKEKLNKYNFYNEFPLNPAYSVCTELCQNLTNGFVKKYFFI